MILERSLISDLKKWKSLKNRSPLVLRGARQVGKSFLVEYFGKTEFESTITINFELSPEFKACFQNLNPKAICNAITALTNQKITPEKTLLFFDEIQDCPEAIQSLRYFKEKMPELHVISAGSLLELALKHADYRLPVGRVNFLYIYPLSFSEYLTTYNIEVLEQLKSTTVKKPLPHAIHTHLLKHIKQFMILGGMPESLINYKKNEDIHELQMTQTSIIEVYEKDLSHYAKEYGSIDTLRTCFKKLPMLIGQQIKYSKIHPDIRSRELKNALSILEDVSILHRIHHSTASGLPLDVTSNEKKFKMNFIDVGLAKRFLQIDADLLLNNDFMLLNKGAIAEQFVGQELLAYSPAYQKTKLYFWARDHQHAKSEIDFLFTHQQKIFPIEVKSGQSGTLKSMHQFLKEHPECPFGVRISQNPLSFDKNMLSVPLYLIGELPRLIEEQLNLNREVKR